MAEARATIVNRKGLHARAPARFTGVYRDVIEDGSLRNAQLANSGTWVGGVCFLLGAIFLIPEEIKTSET